MYIIQPVPICFRLLRQEIARAFSRACAKTGKRIAARIAMIAITTRSSIRVKPVLRLDLLQHILATSLLGKGASGKQGRKPKTVITSRLLRQGISVDTPCYQMGRTQTV